ncbi:MAG: MurR/RpiR family transcriptional regulator [Clostridia bacterium]|nr:MurR/RpiR family transcriptional regulator [Clostridia bacterium]
MNIIEIIEQKYENLTRKQKQIADYMRNHAADMCFMTLKELSERVEVSEMTVLKLCGLLDFGSYNEIKQAFRNLQGTRPLEGDRPSKAYLTEGLPEDMTDIFGQVCREEMEGVMDFLRGFNSDEYRKAARMICRAKGVLLLGSGVSVQMAGYLRSRLVQCGVACLCFDARREEEVQAALHMINEDLLVMPMSFPEYPQLVNRIVRYAKEKGAALLGVTDSTRAELAAMCDMCLYCPCYNHLYSDSQTTAVLAADLLSMAVRLEQDNTGAGAQAAIAINRVFEEI